jgi:hypothetical protein
MGRTINSENVMKLSGVRIFFSLLILSFFSVASTYSQEPEKGDSWKKVQAIKGLPFCAFILGDNPKGVWGSREIYILVEQTEVTESNLRILLRTISDSYPEPINLEAWVITDPERLKSFYSERGSSGGEANVFKGAFYKRGEKVELFRYNPNFPEQGLQTVTLRGKE